MFTALFHSCSDQVNEDDEVGLKSVYLTPDASLTNRYLLWDVGQEIPYCFMNGNDGVKDRVRYCMLNWMSYANVKFVEVSSSQAADVRIKFGYAPTAKKGYSVGGCAWPGKEYTLRITDHSQPTMELNILGLENKDTLSSRNLVYRTIMHELGHVLGLFDEFENVNCNVTWNKSVIYDSLKSCMSFDKINTFLYHLSDEYKIWLNDSARLTESKAFDSKSIMMYETPKSWNKQGVGFHANNKLSALDRFTIAELYPYGDGIPFWRWDWYGLPAYSYRTEFEDVKSYDPEKVFRINTNPMAKDAGYKGSPKLLGKIHKTKQYGTVPLYSYSRMDCLNGYAEYCAMHLNNFLTTYKNEIPQSALDQCPGWCAEGIAGYVYQTGGDNRVKILRYYNAETGFHLYVNEEDLNKGTDKVPSGYKLEGTAFYLEKI